MITADQLDRWIRDLEGLDEAEDIETHKSFPHLVYRTDVDDILTRMRAAWVDQVRAEVNRT